MALTALAQEIAVNLGNGLVGKKFTIPYTELTGVADTTATVPLFTLPAGAHVVSARQKHSQAFAGTSITDMSCVVGKAGTTNWLLTDLDIDAAVADTTLVQVNGHPTTSGHAAVAIIATIGSTGANLSALTAGSVDIWIYYIYPTTAI